MPRTGANALVLQDNLSDQMPGYSRDEITMLEINKIECFVADNEKTFALYPNKRRYLIRKRLYELEEIFPPVKRVDILG